MGATAIVWSLVALTPIYGFYILVAVAVARHLFRDRGGKFRIWIPPAIFITIEIAEPRKSDPDKG
jgi:hypothetical protein